MDQHDVFSTDWTAFTPRTPELIFFPQDDALLDEYEQGWSIGDVMGLNGDLAPGIVTTHDQFAISWTEEEAIAKVERFLKTSSEDEARALWRLCSTTQWNYGRAESALAKNDWRDHVVPVLYRPFDVRWTVYDPNVAVHRRERVMNHMLQENLALVTARSNKSALPDHFFCADTVVETKCGEATTQSVTVPLLLYPDADDLLTAGAPGIPTPNLSAPFLAALKGRVGTMSLSPEDIFAYIYAVFYSMKYRMKYGRFINRGYPRFPLPTDARMMKSLVRLGHQLVDVHLMKGSGGNEPTYPEPGNNAVERVEYEDGRIMINDVQYFGGVAPEAWAITIGGYQVAHKWLKDRKGRTLTFNELKHYMRVIASLDETVEITRQIDAVMPG